MDNHNTCPQTDSFDRHLIDNIPFLWNTAKIFQKNDDDAKDLLQDTLYKALIHKKKLKNGPKLKSWLKAILRNTFITQCRQKKQFYRDVDINSYAFSKEYLRDPVLYPIFHPSDILCNHHISDIYNLAFRNLPSKYKYFIVLRDIEGYSYSRIVEFLNCPVGTVRSTLHIGRKIMLKTYKKLHSTT